MKKFKLLAVILSIVMLMSNFAFVPAYAVGEETTEVLKLKGSQFETGSTATAGTGSTADNHSNSAYFAKAEQAQTASYKFNVVTAGYYSVTFTHMYAADVTVTINNKTVTASPNAASSTTTKDLCRMYFEAGEHTMDISAAVTADQAFRVASVELIAYPTATIGGSSATKVSAYDYSIGELHIDDSAANYNYSDDEIETEWTGAGITGRVDLFRSGEEVTYVLNAESAGVYTLTTAAGGSGKFDIYVNDMTTPVFDNTTSGSTENATLAETVQGNITLNQGENKIKMAYASGSTRLLGFELEPAAKLTVSQSDADLTTTTDGTSITKARNYAEIPDGKSVDTTFTIVKPGYYNSKLTGNGIYAITATITKSGTAENNTVYTTKAMNSDSLLTDKGFFKHYFEAGTYTVNLAVAKNGSSNDVFKFRTLVLEKIENPVKAIAGDAATKVRAYDYVMGQISNMADTYTYNASDVATEWANAGITGRVDLNYSGDNVTYVLNAESAGLYTIATVGAGGGNFDIYVNDMTTPVFDNTTTGSSDTKDLVKMAQGSITLNQGENKIKMSFGTATARLLGFELAPADKVVAVTGATKFAFYKDAVAFANEHGKGATSVMRAAYDDSYLDELTDGYFDWSAVNKPYAKYAINVQQAGVYKLSVVAGSEGDMTFDITTKDGAGTKTNRGVYTSYKTINPDVDFTQIQLREGASGTLNYYRYGYKDEVGNIYLEAGKQELTISLAAGSGGMYSWYLEKVANEEPIYEMYRGGEADEAADMASTISSGIMSARVILPSDMIGNPVFVIFAIYDDNFRIKHVATESITALTKEVVDVTIPDVSRDGDDCSCKVFLWNGAENISPLTPAHDPFAAN